MEWQPIDTAPKDGTWILTWARDDSACEFARWEQSYHYRRTVRSGWIVKGRGFSPQYAPTRWMPIPALPVPTPGA